MMAFLRTWHSYLSVFVAPSIIFFALTGALQVFRLHEAHKGYQPPALIEKLGRLHKDQVFAREERHEPAVEDAPVPPMRPHDEAAPGAQEESEPEPLPTLLLKWFFLAGAVVLALTSSLGYTFSTLASTTDDLAFSNNGGTTYSYTPAPNGNGVDPNVTNIRINPKGTFAGDPVAGAPSPSCTASFRVRIK